MPTTTWRPSLVTEMLLGRPERGILRRISPDCASITLSVLSDSLLMYTRVPSGEKLTPCGNSMPRMTWTTLWVAESMTSTVSAALLVT